MSALLRHGHCRRMVPKTSTWLSWRAMRQRCTSPNHKSWPRYGGRGITICERWESFEAFLEDMGERPEGMSLDRIDSSRGYEPGNCRWANALAQTRTRSWNKLTLEQARAIRDDPRPQPEIAQDYGISQSSVSLVKNGQTWREA